MRYRHSCLFWSNHKLHTTQLYYIPSLLTLSPYSILTTDRVSPHLWAHRAAVQSGRLVWANRGVTAVCVLPTHIMLNKIHYIRLKWTLI